MRNEDIEILDDFSETQMPNTSSQANNEPKPVEQTVASGSNQIIDDFDKMVNEAPNYASAPVTEPLSNDNVAPVNEPSNNGYDNNNQINQINDNNNQINQINQINDNNGLYNNQLSNNFSNDNSAQQENPQDLTITAVYPNGFAVDQDEELENTQVIKTRKKSSNDLPLIILAVVLAITLITLLIMFYL